MVNVGSYGTNRIQAFLNKIGGGLKEDGVWGPKTSSVLLQFQRKLSKHTYCIVDGRPHPETVEQTSVAPSSIPFTLTPADDYVMNVRVPFLSQRDNANKPGSTCNVTSVAMCLAFHGTPVMTDNEQLEDKLFRTLSTGAALKELDKRAPWAKGIPIYQVHAMLEWLLQQNGYPNAKFTTNATRAMLRGSITRGLPFVLATQFTQSGHIVVGTGLTRDDDLIVNDPWGDLMAKYADKDGKGCVIPAETVWKLLDRGSGNMWATILDGILH